MLVPLYGFLEGDTMGLLVLAHEDWTMREVAARLCTSARVRVASGETHAVHFNGTRLEPDATVAGAGLRALDCIHVRPATRNTA